MAVQARRQLAELSSAPARATLLLATAACVAVGAAAVAFPLPISFAVAAVLLAALLVVAYYGTEAFASAALLAGAGTLPLTGLRITGWMTASDLFFLLAAIALVPRWNTWERPRLRELQPEVVGIVLIIFGGLIASVAAAAPLPSLVNLAKFATASAGLLVVVRLWGPTYSEVRPFLWFCVFAASVSAVVAVGQVIAEPFRPIGLTVHPNHLAVISALMAGPAIALACTARRRGQVVAALFSIALAAGVLVSGSRSGLLAYATVVVVMAVVLRRRGVIAAAAASALGVAPVVALTLAGVITFPGGSAIDRVLSKHPSVELADAERAVLLEESLERATERPIIGTGFEHAREAHNIYVQVWSSAGVVGLLGLALIAGATLSVLAALMLRRRSRSDTPAAIVLVGLAAAFAAYLLSGAFHNLLWERSIWATVAFIAALRSGLPSAVSMAPRIADARALAGRLSAPPIRRLPWRRGRIRHGQDAEPERRTP